MLTFWLWKSLRRADTSHPLYSRIYMTPPVPMPWYIALLVIALAPFLLLPGIVLMSAVYSLRWSAQVAATLAEERAAGRFELLSLTPPGALGAAWATCRACLQRHGSMGQIQSVGSWVMRLAFLWLIATSLRGSPTPVRQADWRPIYSFLVLFAALAIDHAESMVMACLVGTFVATRTTGRLEAMLGAAGIFALFETMTVVVPLLFGLIVLPSIYTALNAPILGAAITTPLITLLLFAGLREAVITGFWRAVQDAVNAGPDDVRLVTG
jgi:hypothetical protein